MVTNVQHYTILTSYFDFDSFQVQQPGLKQVPMVKGPGAEAAEELIDEEGVPGAGHTDQHKPNFVKHLNKTRTFSAKQKWEWAFDKILTVSGNFFITIYRLIIMRNSLLFNIYRKI